MFRGWFSVPNCARDVAGSVIIVHCGSTEGKEWFAGESFLELFQSFAISGEKQDIFIVKYLLIFSSI